MRKPYLEVTIRLTSTLRPVDGWVVRRDGDQGVLLAELDASGWVPPVNFLDRLLSEAVTQEQSFRD